MLQISPHACDFPPTVQLKGTIKYRGVLRYSSKGRWYNLCSDQWTIYNGDQVCEQLGFGYALEVRTYLVKNDSMGRLKLNCHGSKECSVTKKTRSCHLALLSLECSGRNGEYKCAHKNSFKTHFFIINCPPLSIRNGLAKMCRFTSIKLALPCYNGVVYRLSVLRGLSCHMILHGPL